MNARVDAGSRAVSREYTARQAGNTPGQKSLERPDLMTSTT